MPKEMTALMQLIREIEVLKHESENTRDYFKEQGMEIASIGSGGLAVAYRACIEKATSLLPVEKEQIVSTGKHFANYNGIEDKDIEEYYDNKFTK